jgi:murein DD-endopeptidase MepM/ murein hydrolase activator NlpD
VAPSSARPCLAGFQLAIATAALSVLLALPAAAEATTGGAPTPGATPPAHGSPTGTPAAEAPSAGAISLLSARATPRKSFFYGFRYPSLRFSIASTQPQNDLQIDVVDASGEAVRSFYRNDVAPNTEVGIRWDGTTAEGRPARNGRYSFRISAQGTTQIAARATTSSEPLSLGFALYGYAFPVLGPHDFGDAAARFGAPRSGHTHQGQDVMAACGLTEVAARGGTVQYSGYEGNAGNYIVIDGKGTGLDFMYAHLAQPSPLKTGEPVRTGQPIGIVGDTGDATACHLHFEIWTAPGWYEGGSPIDPLPYLEKWDAYS